MMICFYCKLTFTVKIFILLKGFSYEKAVPPQTCLFFLKKKKKAGQSLCLFEWWQSQNYDCLILPFTELVKKIKLKIMLMNIMHELLHGSLKDRMSLLSSHSENNMSHNPLICRQNNRAERKFCLSDNTKCILPIVHMFTKISQQKQ